MINAIKASLAATLRDYETPDDVERGLNNNDEMAIYLADTIINTGLMPSKSPEWFTPDYKKLFNDLGGDVWANNVLCNHRFISKLLDTNKLTASDLVNLFNTL